MVFFSKKKPADSRKTFWSSCWPTEYAMLFCLAQTVDVACWFCFDIASGIDILLVKKVQEGKRDSSVTGIEHFRGRRLAYLKEGHPIN